jgi:predicted ArsR family transcriptional regulator
LGKVNQSGTSVLRLKFAAKEAVQAQDTSLAGVGTQRRPATEAEAKALASGVRLRIIRLCMDTPLTNKEIAGRLGANPATILHHVRTLVATGFLVPAEERRGPRGSREVPYRSTGKSWTLDVQEVAGYGGANRAMLDAFHEELALVDLAKVDFARLGVRLTPQERDELSQRFSDLLNEYMERGPTPGGQPYSIFLAIYEDVSRP